MNIPKRTINIGGEVFEIPDIFALFGKGASSLLFVIIGIWLLNGIYIVKADEQGVVRRFGKFVRVTSPGIHYRIPSPFEKVDRPKVTQVKRAEVGFRTVDPGPPARYMDVSKESIMLTGNLNIVDCDMIVQYRINDPTKYLFNVRDVDRTVQVAAEAALRQVIGRHEIDEALTTGKGVIQEETKEILQMICDTYEIGLLIVAVQLQDVHPPREVVDAFKDVASAKEDLNKLINQAQGYNNDIIPRTRGQAAKMVKEAEAWAEERVTKSEGDAENFLRILKEYKKSTTVTRKRLLLETMEEVLPGLKKYIIKSDKQGNLMNVIGLQSDMNNAGGRR